MIKNIIFDIGGVLVDFDPAKTLREMGLPEEEVQVIAQHTAFNPFWIEFDRGVMDKEDVIKKMKEGLPENYRAAADRFFHQEIMKTVTSFNYSAGWVKSLKERGLKIYLLTNYASWMFDYHFENTFTFAPYVDGQVVSGKEKVVKPDPKIYQIILSRYNLNPEESVFIDDRLENVEAAQKEKIHGIHFTNYDEVVRKLEELL